MVDAIKVSMSIVLITGALSIGGTMGITCHQSLKTQELNDELKAIKEGNQTEEKSFEEQYSEITEKKEKLEKKLFGDKKYVMGDSDLTYVLDVKHKSFPYKSKDSNCADSIYTIAYVQVATEKGKSVFIYPTSDFVPKGPTNMYYYLLEQESIKLSELFSIMRIEGTPVQDPIIQGAGIISSTNQELGIVLDELIESRIKLEKKLNKSWRGYHLR
ncbi:hypothetical protein HOK51_04185 [Candidatus Woesearchaeota archaeon]|jgi:hypothetical protein|nr:hypothetical protein [Candidatus Woesearchaeota archaeon]MBT6519021.1 hypothetical protein [Candidatus Woesearchaeota archaeon]MBT7368780.1 hypothetical protein [Candidatus Woesearchaeota archaeon]